MKRIIKEIACILPVIFLILSSSSTAFSSDQGERVTPQEIQALIKTIHQLQKRVEALEKKVQEYEKRLKKASSQEETPPHPKVKEVVNRIKISADATLIAQGTLNNRGNKKDEGDVQDGSLSYHLELESQIWRHGKAFMALEGGSGEGLKEELPSLSGVNDEAKGDMAAEVIEAWYEQEVPLSRYGSLVFTLGKVDLTNYFDLNEVANSGTTQFLSTGFAANLAVEWPDDNGLGARVTWTPVEWLDLSLGWADAQGDWEDIFDESFSIAEIDLRPSIGGLQGNYRIYAWLNTKRHLEVSDLKEVGQGRKTWSEVKNDRRNWGIGLSLDQKVSKGITLFARAGIMDDGVVAGSRREESVDTVPIKGAYSFGLQLDGIYWGRRDDALGIAFGCMVINDEAQELYREVFYDYTPHPGEVDMKNEYHLEVYYRLSFFERKLEFSPDFQMIWNPNGNGDGPTTAVIGTRMHLKF